MSITATAAPTTLPTSTGTSDTSARVPQKTLGQDDFLKLLTVQLSQQDPMKPMEDTSFMAQMAQFSSLQQTGQMATTMTALKASNDLSSASAMLGRHVTVTTAGGDVSGDVAGVDASSGSPQIMMDGKSYPLSSVIRIEPVALPTT